MQTMSKSYPRQQGICRQFSRSGTCSFGVKCRYAHINSNNKDVPHQTFNNSYEKMDRREQKASGYCKFYAAGYCQLGSQCNDRHDSDAINTKEDGWLQYEGSDPQHKMVGVPRSFDMKALPKQPFRYLLVLDLEGKEEIVELPCILIDCETMCEVGRFHRFCRPTAWGEIDDDMAKKHPTFFNAERRSVAFSYALGELNTWLAEHWGCDVNCDGSGYGFIPVICGNWDIKTQVPKQCRISGIDVPAWCNSWCNVKDLVVNFYKVDANRVRGLVPTLNYLDMDLHGNHHLGMDDATSIARILVRMACDGATLSYTASRDERGYVRYLYPMEKRVSLMGRNHRDSWRGRRGRSFGRGRSR